MHILTIVGARPQFIKAAVVTRAIAEQAGMRETLLHTGQHFSSNMSAVFFNELGIPAPQFNLDIHGVAHGEMTGRMLMRIEQVLEQTRPDALLVYGDTNSTLAGALAAVKLHIPVVHVEAGLRSFNRRMPEEINRVLTDHASALLLAPTGLAVRNLAREGIAGDRVALVGDVMYDAALVYGEEAGRRSEILQRLSLGSASYALCTIHRAESTDDAGRLRKILTALSMLAHTIPVVLPLHPRTRAALQAGDALSSLPPGLRIIEPVGYLDMVRLESGASLIVTDSGGVQKEAYFHRVPCVTVRDETEWQGLLESGWNRLAPPDDAGAMFEAMCSALGSAGRDVMLYGDGAAAKRVIQAIKTMR